MLGSARYGRRSRASKKQVRGCSLRGVGVAFSEASVVLIDVTMLRGKDERDNININHISRFVPFKRQEHAAISFVLLQPLCRGGYTSATVLRRPAQPPPRSVMVMGKPDGAAEESRDSHADVKLFSGLFPHADAVCFDNPDVFELSCEVSLISKTKTF
jgi:hypothetical protein